MLFSVVLISAGITAQAGVGTGVEQARPAGFVLTLEQDGSAGIPPSLAGSELSAAERGIAVDAVKALEEDLASARGKASSPRFGLPETELSREYAAMARTVEHQGSLDVLLRAMAGFCVAHPGFKDSPWAHARAMVRGMISYVSGEGEQVRFQGRPDWTLHFAYGAYLDMTYGLAVARYAARYKESRDSQAEGNHCDYDDYAASILGAFWADKKTPQLESWLGTWASGKRNLAAVPILRFGGEAHGVRPRSEILRAADEFAERVMAVSRVPRPAGGILQGSAHAVAESAGGFSSGGEGLFELRH